MAPILHVHPISKLENDLDNGQTNKEEDNKRAIQTAVQNHAKASMVNTIETMYEM